MKDFEFNKESDILSSCTYSSIALLDNALQTFRYNVHTKIWIVVASGKPPYIGSFTFETNGILPYVFPSRYPNSENFHNYFYAKYGKRFINKVSKYEDLDRSKENAEQELICFINGKYSTEEIQKLLGISSVSFIKSQLSDVTPSRHPHWYLIGSDKHKKIMKDYLNAKDELEVVTYIAFVDEVKHQIKKGVVEKIEIINSLQRVVANYERPNHNYGKGFAKKLISMFGLIGL